MKCMSWNNKKENKTTCTAQKRRSVLVVASKQIWLKVATCKWKYTVMSRNQDAGWSHSIKADNLNLWKSGKSNLGTTLTNQNSVQEEIKSRLMLRNVCYGLVRNILSSNLLSNNIKIKIYRTIIMPVGLYGCETWSLTLREEHRLRMFQDRVLRRLCEPKRY
jgi:hypothetical protein